MKTSIKRIIFIVIAVLLIMAEFYIGIYVNDRIIRPYGGDVIIVIILYAIIRATYPEKKVPAALFVFVFATAYEFTQLIPLADLLGISKEVVRIIMGVSFSWVDIGCYAIGCALCLGYDIWVMRNMFKIKNI